MRFAIRRSPFWRPLLVPLGATEAGSYVEVTAETIHVRFGALFDEVIPRSEVEAAALFDYPWYGGIGWRMNFRGSIGLIGAQAGVVRLDLRDPRKMKFGPFSMNFQTLYVSLEEPDTFLAAVRPRA